jgi:hypothetical protein
VTQGGDGAALIDSLTDDDMVRLAVRLQKWAVEQQPLRNLAGERVGVDPFATTGRLQVSAGQTIQSLWGNSLWDQSVNAFTTTADRDAQWPTPHDGAMCFTADTGTVWLRNGTWKPVTAGPFGRFVNATGAVATGTSASMCLVPAEPGFWSVAGTAYTFLRAGIYSVTLACDVPGTTDLNVTLRIMQAGNLQRVQSRGDSDGATNWMTCSWLGYRAVNDTLICDITNSAGGSLVFNRSIWMAYLGG